MTPRRLLCHLLVLVVLAGALPDAHAGLIDTGDSLADSRQSLLLLVERQDVRRQLQAFGVEPGAAAARVAAMSDAEAMLLAQRLGNSPAGGWEDWTDVAWIVFCLLLVVIAGGVVLNIGPKLLGR